MHTISIDPIVETEYFAAPRRPVTSHALFDTIVALGTVAPLTHEASRLAASWLAPMDQVMRRAHFADALIAAVAHLEDAVLVTSDKRIARVFPDVALREY